MGLFFLDTSAVVKRYVREVGTDRVLALTDPAAGHGLYIARIALPEAVAAVTRRERGGHLAAADAASALAGFRGDFDRQYRVVELLPTLLDLAAGLARAHGLRRYDAVQLAAAFVVWRVEPALALVSADAELNAAALAEGLVVEDPRMTP